MATRNGGIAPVVDEIGVVVKQRFANFLREFSVEIEVKDPETGRVETKRIDEYVMQIHTMKQYDQNTIFVDFTHVQQFDFNLAVPIREDFYRHEPYLRAAVRDVVGDYYPDFIDVEGVQKEFFVSFFNMQSKLKVRDLKTHEIGTLVAINGTVTRTSEVRPELLKGVFKCLECGTYSSSVEQQFVYTEPTLCRNQQCTNTSKWALDISRSKFVDWQRVRVQENSDEIPPGSLPRTVDVILRHGAVERAKAGDKCTFTGTLVVVPDVSQLLKTKGVSSYKSQGGDRMGVTGDGVTGLKRLGVRDLTYKTSFLACSVQRDGQQGMAPGDGDHDADGNTADEFTQAEKNEMRELAAQSKSRLYQRLVRSIAPTVFGHEEIKRGILLQLFGGVHKSTGEGIRLRGDINVCIVGDPSTAKSQFLKYTCKFFPRAVYTSGKASSAAGLTASVAKDPDTGEFTIEAGALMLADNGICCIDEFDKMDPADQVAIHEAMEQQTISITKAGIQATLNARTSILAAANPIFGRYDRSLTLARNVTIGAAIMSRFDLFFVVLDDCDADHDRTIATHIVNVHQHQEDALDPEIPHEKLQQYVRYARTINPRISDAAKDAVVSCYRRLRQNDAVGAHQTAYRITVRQLESLIRLSEALARLHLDDVVKEEYVFEAFRLLRKSIIHVESGRIELEEEDTDLPEAEQVTPENTEEPNISRTQTRRTSDQETSNNATNGTTEKNPKTKYVMDYAKYRRIALEVARYLRMREEQAMDDPNSIVGMKQTDLLNWYLEQHSEEFESLEDLATERKMLKKVINRLIRQDGILVVASEGETIDDRLLMVNPDFTFGDESVAPM